MAVPTKKTNYVAEGQGRLISRYKNQTTLLGLLAVYLGEIQFLENVLWDVINLRMLATAANTNPTSTASDTLQQLGKLVGQDRSGLNNSLYGAVIALRIRANRSDGRSEDIIQLAAALKVVSSRYQYTLPAAITATQASPVLQTTLPPNYLFPLDLIELSNQPGVQYAIQSLTPTTITLASPFLGPSGSGLTLTLDSGTIPPPGGITAPLGQINYLEMYPASYIVEIWELLSQLVGLDLLTVARTPGVYAILHYTTWKQISVMGSRVSGTFTATNGTNTLTASIPMTGVVSNGDSIELSNQTGTFYSVTAIAGSTLTISPAFSGASASGLSAYRALPAGITPMVWGSRQGGVTAPALYAAAVQV